MRLSVCDTAPDVASGGQTGGGEGGKGAYSSFFAISPLGIFVAEGGKRDRVRPTVTLGFSREHRELLSTEREGSWLW